MAEDKHGKSKDAPLQPYVSKMRQLTDSVVRRNGKIHGVAQTKTVKGGHTHQHEGRAAH